MVFTSNRFPFKSLSNATLRIIQTQYPNSPHFTLFPSKSHTTLISLTLPSLSTLPSYSSIPIHNHTIIFLNGTTEPFAHTTCFHSPTHTLTSHDNPCNFGSTLRTTRNSVLLTTTVCLLAHRRVTSRSLGDHLLRLRGNQQSVVGERSQRVLHARHLRTIPHSIPPSSPAPNDHHSFDGHHVHMVGSDEVLHFGDESMPHASSLQALADNGVGVHLQSRARHIHHEIHAVEERLHNDLVLTPSPRRYRRAHRAGQSLLAQHHLVAQLTHHLLRLRRLVAQFAACLLCCVSHHGNAHSARSSADTRSPPRRHAPSTSSQPASCRIRSEYERSNNCKQ